jgi:glycosyltransferase involved in cell wall biosynthesis
MQVYGNLNLLGNFVQIFMASTKRILLFDTVTDGHHSDYLIHLIGYYSTQSDVHLGVASSAYFKEHFDARQAEEGNLWGPNVEFIELPEGRLQSIHSKSVYLRSILEWNLLVDTAKAFQANHALLMFFDYLQLGILIGKRSPCPVSSIYFRPNFTLDSTDFYTKIKKWMLARVLNSGQINHLFCLEKSSMPFLTPISGKVGISPIADPVKQFAIPKKEKEKFASKFPTPQNKKVALCYGNLDGRKGIEVFIDACGKLSESELQKICLFLAGPISSEYQQIIEKKLAEIPGLEVIRAYGYMSPYQTQIAFESADFILILYQNFLNMSSVLIRAAQAGKPSFATETGVIGEMVRQQDLGLAVDATSASAVAAGLSSILTAGISFSAINAQKIAAENSVEAFTGTIAQALD